MNNEPSRFQQLAELRLTEAQALFATGHPDGAYYLAGYAVECALKACIAKRTQLHDFPEKKLVNDSHTHDLGKLLQLAELKTELDAILDTDPVMRSNLELFRIGQRQPGIRETSLGCRRAAEGNRR